MRAAAAVALVEVLLLLTRFPARTHEKAVWLLGTA